MKLEPLYVLALASTTVVAKPGKPLVTSKAYQATVSGKNLLKHAKNLFKFSQIGGGHTRMFGSVGHNATVDYIKSSLDKTGFYHTEIQTFPLLFSDGSATFKADGVDYTTGWFTYGPSGDVNAPLVIVNNFGCGQADFPAAVRGNIALVQRGNCTFSDKLALSGAAGAAGAIVYNNVAGALDGGTLGTVTNPLGPYIPAGAISGSEGVALVAAIQGGKQVVGALHVDSVTENRWTSNVIATSKTGDQNNIVMSGGHTDSVPAGPGINDNGSGSMTVLELALQLPRFSVKNAVRFAFWTGEEFGLLGADHYVSTLPEAERAKIALYFNFDMVASPNFGYFIYDGDGSAFNITGPPGSDHIEHTFENFFASAKLKSAPTEFNGRSDYGPFLDVGIPAGGLFTGAEGVKKPEEVKLWGGQAGVAYDHCYHQACDTVDNLNLPAWVENTKAAAHGIATYARSLEGIPRIAKRAVLSLVALRPDRRTHAACGHVILDM